MTVVLRLKHMYDDVRALLGYGFKVKPTVGAELLGVRPEPPEDATEATLPGRPSASPAGSRPARRPGRAPRPAHPGRPGPAGGLRGRGLPAGGLALLWRRR